MDELLKELQQRELNFLDGERYQIEQRYVNISPAIERTSKLLNADPEIMVQACALVAQKLEGVEWYDILRHLQAYLVTYNRIFSAAVKDDK